MVLIRNGIAEGKYKHVEPNQPLGIKRKYYYFVTWNQNQMLSICHETLGIPTYNWNFPRVRAERKEGDKRLRTKVREHRIIPSLPDVFLHHQPTTRTTLPNGIIWHFHFLPTIHWARPKKIISCLKIPKVSSIWHFVDKHNLLWQLLVRPQKYSAIPCLEQDSS